MVRVILIALLFCASAGLSCVSIDGGAVEASWVVVTHDGRTISDCGCTCPRVAKVRLALIPEGGGPDACAGKDTCAFSCNSKTGATRFDIAPGTYAVSLVPVGEDGADLPVGVPAGATCGAAAPVGPVVREVAKGRVTQLDPVVVEVDCAAECGGSDNDEICRK